MAVVSLKSRPACRNFWQQRIQLNLTYWQNYLAQNSADATALEREWQAIVRAILLGLDLPSAWPDVFQLIVDFSNFMERRGYWDAWQSVLHRALPAATRADEITLSMLLARLHQRQGQVRPMIASYRRTIRLARQAGNRYEEARACSNLGYHFIGQGHWHRGEVLCCYALDIFEALDSNHGRAHTENHLGVLFYRRHEWAAAEQYLTRACAIWETMGDSHGLLNGNNNLGILYIEMTRFQQALTCFEQALTFAEALGETTWLGNIYHNMGLVYQKQHRFNEAENYLQRARQLSRQFANQVEYVRVEESFGELYLVQHRFEEARTHLTRARSGWRELGYIAYEIQTVCYLIECDLAQGHQSDAAVRLADVEAQFNAFDPRQRYPQLHAQITRFRHSLPNATAERQTVAKEAGG